MSVATNVENRGFSRSVVTTERCQGSQLVRKSEWITSLAFSFVWYTSCMTTRDGVMEIKKTFDINSIYAKRVLTLPDRKFIGMM